MCIPIAVHMCDLISFKLFSNPVVAVKCIFNFSGTASCQLKGEGNYEFVFNAYERMLARNQTQLEFDILSIVTRISL